MMHRNLFDVAQNIAKNGPQFVKTMLHEQFKPSARRVVPVYLEL